MTLQSNISAHLASLARDWAPWGAQRCDRLEHCFRGKGRLARPEASKTAAGLLLSAIRSRLILGQNSMMEPSKLSAARAYALSMHGAQMYGPHPYSHHLDAVAATLAPYGLTAQVIGYLHDVVEDTGATIAEVPSRFGDEVAACVALLTDEPGANRKERKSKTYAKLAKVAGSEELALVVKSPTASRTCGRAWLMPIVTFGTSIAVSMRYSRHPHLGLGSVMNSGLNSTGC